MHTVVPGQELNDTPSPAVASMPQSVGTATSTCTQINANANAETNASHGLSIAASVSCSTNHEVCAPASVAPVPLVAGSLINARPGSMVRVPETITNGSKC